MNFKSLFLVSFFFLSVSYAELYKYTDDSGNTHYVDNIKKIPEKYWQQINTANLPEIGKAAAVDWNSKVSEDERYEKKEVSNEKVDVYVAPNCQYCVQLELFLNQNNISYSRHDITESIDADVHFRELGGTGTPLIKIGNEVIKGYNPGAIKKILKMDTKAKSE